MISVLHYPEACVLIEALGGEKMLWMQSSANSLLCLCILSLFNSKTCFGSKDAHKTRGKEAVCALDMKSADLALE